MILQSEQGGVVLKAGSRLFKIETTLAAVSGVLGVVTLFWRDWLEVTGWDPDNHGGSVEWVIAIVFLASAITLGAMARREHRRSVPAVGTA
jgi:hypothetical protein